MDQARVVVFHARLKERQHNDEAPSQRAKACRDRGSYTITVTPEHKGLLKDTVDFSQYKSDSPSRPARGGKTHLMILLR